MRQFIIDSLEDGLAIRARRSSDLQTLATDISGHTTPITVRICSLPRSNPVAMHLFIRFCHLLASRVGAAPGLAGGPPALQINSLAIASSYDENMRGRGLDMRLLMLPLHGHTSFTSEIQPTIIIFHYRQDPEALSVRALEMQIFENQIPVTPFPSLSVEPAIKYVEFDHIITEQLLRANILQFPGFHELLHGRVTRGYGIRSITFHGMPVQTTVPPQLRDAARTWGEAVSLTSRQGPQGKYDGKTLIFHPLPQ
ncbi:hypothetical protein PENSPDRAFT_650846 [Peniophora sp. CONT]|nr:hypothetical protein PENSPDRAFT_650846 [Peniophora sp. CONT]